MNAMALGAFGTQGHCRQSYVVQAMKAIWNGAVIAESDETVVVERNHYFPMESANPNYLRDSVSHSVCPWKGTASYKDVIVGGQENPDAAWYYAETKPEADQIRGRIAFWKGVQVVP